MDPRARKEWTKLLKNFPRDTKPKNGGPIIKRVILRNSKQERGMDGTKRSQFTKFYGNLKGGLKI